MMPKLKRRNITENANEATNDDAKPDNEIITIWR